MENQELKHYIDAQLTGGTSPDELKKLLMHHGWAPEIVDAHLPPRVPGTLPLAAIGAGAPHDDLYIDDRKKRKLAIFFLVLPFALLVLILTVYAVNSFVVNAALSKPQATVVQPSGTVVPLGSAPALDEAIGLSLPTTTGLGQADKRATIAAIVNVALGLFGLLAFLSLFICIPIGIVLLVRSRRALKPGVAYDERSGKDEASVIPPELGHWNWGAAFLTIWWGIYYRVWITFLIFVPVIGQFWWVIMGIKGNEWAWQKNKWLSVDEFKKAQKKWAVWAIALLVLSLLMGMACASLIVISAARFGKRPVETVQQLNPAEGLYDYGLKVSGAPLGTEAMNATYGINGQLVTLKNGTSASAQAGSSAMVTTNFFGAAGNGDLNGDGAEDMAFVLWQQAGGSGTFYYLVAALAVPNGPALGTEGVLLGDRIKPVSTAIRSGLVVVTYLDRKPDEPMTAVPSVTVVRSFKIVNGKLEEIK
jgi:hypothetical protein